MFGSVLFCCLLLEYLLSLCWISTFKPSYLSSSLLSSACPSPLHFVSFLKTVFHIINFVFGLWILPLITLIYLLVLQYHFLSLVSFFNCQLPFHLILMSYHLIFDLFFSSTPVNCCVYFSSVPCSFKIDNSLVFCAVSFCHPFSLP